MYRMLEVGWSHMNRDTWQNMLEGERCHLNKMAKESLTKSEWKNRSLGPILSVSEGFL